MNKVSAIDQCRVSGSNNLITILNLGNQVLTGIFPKSKNEKITNGPLEVVWCPDSGLLQLKHSYDLSEMYGENYGYKSGLNNSMVEHLKQKIFQLERLYSISSGDIVIDIGSNDATLLKSYTTKGLKRIGIDPIGNKFKKFYTDGLELIPDFFSKDIFNKKYGKAKAKIITSIAMFYDLENPKKFVLDILEVLDKNGIWHFEQSYMPTMLRMNSYDTICHEHLEYYSLLNIKALLNECGFKIIDVVMNSINGGSFAVTACKKENPIKSNDVLIEWLLNNETRMNLNTLKPFKQFKERVYEHRTNLRNLINNLNSDGKKIIGYGASTKGNVLLQFCRFSEKELICMAEVNQEKFGSYTPGSNIPILSEEEAKSMNPDYMLVLPWHFKETIIKREKKYISNGGKLIFPLPEIEIV
jgi:hypothetical protein